MTLGGPQSVSVVSEPGLYKLVQSSRKPAAREFDAWVRNTVLPAIRKDGMYVQGEEKLDLSNDADLAKMTLTVMEALQKKVEEAEAKAAVGPATGRACAAASPRPRLPRPPPRPTSNAVASPSPSPAWSCAA